MKTKVCAEYFAEPGPMQGWYIHANGNSIDPSLIQGREGRGGGERVIYDGCPCDLLMGPFATEADALEFVRD